MGLTNNYNAGRVSAYPPENDGSYFHYSMSGALTIVAAAAVVWAFRFGGAKLAIVEFFRLRAVPTTPFTAAQLWGFDAVVGRSYSVSHTGGTQYLPADAGGWKKRTNDATSVATEIRMGTTAALGGGTVTPDASPFTADLAWELVAGATVPRSKVLAEYRIDQGQGVPLVLAANEGILVRPTHTMGAGGVVTLAVEIAWREVDPSVLAQANR